MCSFFFFNDTATTEIYTLSLHDALPILSRDPVGREGEPRGLGAHTAEVIRAKHRRQLAQDRKSTRLNSSHLVISYAVFCLKKKKNKKIKDRSCNGCERSMLPRTSTTDST